MKTVVVAEDEKLIRMLAAERFADAGYNVIESGHAGEALAALRDSVVHILFTDIHMPGGMDGLSLARLVRQQWPFIHILVASGDYHPASEEMPSGGCFFRKPYLIDRVLDRAHVLMAS